VIVFKSKPLTTGNLKNNHIYITPFRDRLPEDVFGGNTKDKPSPKRIRLEYEGIQTQTFVPSTNKGKPRTFFEDRKFVGKFFEKSGAGVGDTILFEQLSPHHLKLSIRKSGTESATDDLPVPNAKASSDRNSEELPSHPDLLLPILRVLAEESQTISGLKRTLSVRLKLTKEQIEFMRPSRSENLFGFHVQNAKLCLLRAGLVCENDERVIEITKIGSEFLVSDPPSMNMNTLHQFRSYKEFLSEKRNQTKDTSDVGAQAAIDNSIDNIVETVLGTIRYANGQREERVAKNKEMKMSDQELKDTIRQLIEGQGGICQLSGLPLQFLGDHDDTEMLASLDRIDSNRHYEKDNLQVVCRFINFWKGSTPDHEFRRLMAKVRGVDTE